jgi:tetratricopeptide (TPR) repeat protein
VRGIRSAALIIGLLLCGPFGSAHAQQREAAAKEAFFAGKAAYDAKRFDEALEQFKRCYTLGGQPALLYNIASTLQNLNRPGEAADALREYLSVRKNDADRPEIENRIASLDRAQALIDRESEHKRKREEEAAARRRRELELERPATPAGALLTEAQVERKLEVERDRERRRKRNLALGLGIGLGALAVGGIAAGVVCGLGHCSSSPAQDYDFGRVTVTR